jgi:CTP:molybdopterin cytidylyltransferase MocA
VNRHVAAIILAAGLSERMGEFKPLLPLGEMAVLERCAGLFRESGVEDIRVVIGHRGEELRALLAKLDVMPIENPRYREGMFSSVKAGLATIGSDVDSFFVLPVDIPLVRRSTIRRLLDTRGVKGCDVAYPVFRGERGHPPLIAGCYAKEIVNWQGDGGLKRALAKWEASSLDVSVADSNILLDMDTAEDYRKMLARIDRLEIPTPEECTELLEKVFRVGEGVTRHGRAVARVAVKIAEGLNRSGLNLDIPLVEASSLLHDIAKGKPDHARMGARLLAEEGFGAVAAPVANHMDMEFHDGDTISARQILYLADKLVSGDRIVSLEERFEFKLERYRHEPEILDRIDGRLKVAREIKKRIEGGLGRPLQEVLAS